MFDKFIELRIIGYDRDLAFMEAFEVFQLDIDISNLSHNALAAECNEYFRANYARRLQEAKPEQLWSAKEACAQLLRIVRDPSARHTAKIQAIASLNVLLGITEMTETGQQKLVDREMADFYSRRVQQTYGGVTH